MNPFLAITCVAGALGLLLPIIRLLQRAGRLSGESARKCLHIAMGIVCLSFPWLFDAVWPVWLLAAIAAVVLAGVRSVPLLRTSVGSVLYDVKRSSLGELWFPVSVAAVFTFSAGEPLLYLIPVAVLTFADAAGALFGTRLGRHTYTTLEGVKSVEGSVAVGVTGALVTFLPLTLAGQPWITALLIAIAIGLFALNLEAISTHGLDNLFLPVAVYAQLQVHLDTPVHALAANLSVLFILTVFALVWRRGQIIDEAARFGSALALYFFWTVGGPEWLVSPLVFLASYVWLMPRVPERILRHNLIAVICVGSAGLIWAVAEAYAPNPRWFALFTLGIGTHQAVIGTVRYSQGFRDWGKLAWTGIGILQAVVVQGIAFILLEQNQAGLWSQMVTGSACITLATGFFVVLEPSLQSPDKLSRRWWCQGASALLASVCGLLAFHL